MDGIYFSLLKIFLFPYFKHPFNSGKITVKGVSFHQNDLHTYDLFKAFFLLIEY